jgi:UDP-glucose 4-epimerase
MTRLAESAITWVVGRGLLGSSVERAIGDHSTLWHSPRFDWSDPVRTRTEVERAASRFLADAGQRPWRVAWCAGAGVVATPQAALDEETATLTRLLEVLAIQPGPSERRGEFFLASSAGGVHAGSSGPPFTEATAPRPLAPYGETKLGQEQLARDWARSAGVDLLIGRIANLYGPGQDVSKPQGLISQLVRAAVHRQPTGIYVPLDTVRDYLFADDCGRLVAAGLDRLALDHDAQARPVSVTKILASHRPATVAMILAEFRRVFGRPPRIVLGASPLRRLQVRDLRLRSIVWPELDRRTSTPLATGIQSVFLDMLRRQQAGRLRSSLIGAK